MTTPIVIDTDPGIDDALAILCALADPEIELLGLTTVFGNVSGAQASANARALLELAGARIPVAEGAARPLRRPPAPHATHVHGPTGLGAAGLPPPEAPATGEPAHSALARIAAERPGEVTLVALGPLTNLARALDAHAEIVDTVRRVVVMGGAVRRGGNVTPHAEANIWQDPHAALRVLEAPWSVTLVGLDVTTRVILTPAHLAPVAEAAPRAGGFLASAAETYFRFHAEALGLAGCHLHDPTAVIAAVAPELLRTEALGLSVELKGLEIGRTRETGPGPVEVALGADGPAILARLTATLAAGGLP